MVENILYILSITYHVVFSEYEFYFVNRKLKASQVETTVNILFMEDRLQYFHKSNKIHQPLIEIRKF